MPSSDKEEAATPGAPTIKAMPVPRRIYGALSAAEPVAVIPFPAARQPRVHTSLSPHMYGIYASRAQVGGAAPLATKAPISAPSCAQSGKAPLLSLDQTRYAGRPSTETVTSKEPRRPSSPFMATERAAAASARCAAT